MVEYEVVVGEGEALQVGPCKVRVLEISTDQNEVLLEIDDGEGNVEQVTVKLAEKTEPVCV